MLESVSTRFALLRSGDGKDKEVRNTSQQENVPCRGTTGAWIVRLTTVVNFVGFTIDGLRLYDWHDDGLSTVSCPASCSRYLEGCRWEVNGQLAHGEFKGDEVGAESVPAPYRCRVVA